MTDTARTTRFPTLRTIVALILREVETTHGRAPGGYLWAVLEPVGAIAIYTLLLAFGLRLRHPPLGTVFMLFLATGQLPFSMFQNITRKLSFALRYSRALLQHPAVLPFDAIMARFLLETLTGITVFCIVIGGIHLTFHMQTQVNMPAIFLGLALTAALGLGIGTLNCWLFMSLPLWEQIWAIINRPLFLVSTIFYVFEDIPTDYRGYVWYNPLIHVVGLMRKGFYPTYGADYVSVGYVLAIAMGCLFTGLLLLRFHPPDPMR